jgi:hypothetical protein
MDMNSPSVVEQQVLRKIALLFAEVHAIPNIDRNPARGRLAPLVSARAVGGTFMFVARRWAIWFGGSGGAAERVAGLSKPGNVYALSEPLTPSTRVNEFLQQVFVLGPNFVLDLLDFQPASSRTGGFFSLSIASIKTLTKQLAASLSPS